MIKRSFLKTFSKFFPLPKVLSFDFVGVDMCKDSVKVMKLEESKFGKVPVLYKNYELKKECGIFSSELNNKNCEELVDVFKKIKKDFKVQYVNVSIPELMTYIYKTKLPSSVGKGIGEAVLSSIEENVPIPPEDVLIDNFVTSVDDQELNVVVTAVSKSVINNYTNIIESVGLKPISFEPETHAITRAIVSKGDKNKYLILNLDSCSSSVAVVDDEIVQYTQVLQVATHDFSKEFSQEEAKILKENINKVIIYWETSISNSGKDEIQNLYLVGDYASSQELKNYLEKNLSIGVKFSNVWNNCFDLDEYIPKLHAKESLSFGTATGLALKRIK